MERRGLSTPLTLLLVVPGLVICLSALWLPLIHEMFWPEVPMGSDTLRLRLFGVVIALAMVMQLFLGKLSGSRSVGLVLVAFGVLCIAGTFWFSGLTELPLNYVVGALLVGVGWKYAGPRKKEPPEAAQAVTGAKASAPGVDGSSE